MMGQVGQGSQNVTHCPLWLKVRIRTEAHYFRSQVGIRSESDCFLGQFIRILDISDSDAGLKKKNKIGS